MEGERDELSNKLRRDQDWVVRNLLEKIRRLETEIQTNQKVCRCDEKRIIFSFFVQISTLFFQSLEQLRREKVDLENSLEHEQEVLPFRFYFPFIYATVCLMANLNYFLRCYGSYGSLDRCRFNALVLGLSR